MTETYAYLIFYAIVFVGTIVGGYLKVLPTDVAVPIVTAVLGHGLGTLPGIATNNKSNGTIKNVTT